MAITIDATVGGGSANSFVTLAEMTTYMEGRLNSSSFDDATTDNQNRALAEATRELSAVMWKGYRVDDTQALAWPRQWAWNPDDPTQDYFATTVIPDRIKRATYELALAFLKAGTTDIASIESDRLVKREKIDVIETEYVDTAMRPKGLARYPAVMREIAPLLENTGITNPVIRG